MLNVYLGISWIPITGEGGVHISRYSPQIATFPTCIPSGPRNRLALTVLAPIPPRMVPLSDNVTPVSALEQIAGMTPMETAKHFGEVTKRTKRLEAELADLDKEAKTCKAKLLSAMQEGQWPESFKLPEGGTIYLHSQVWASARDGDHDRLSEVLRELDLVEYLPSKVNSQSISAYVREHLSDDEAAELDVRLASLDQRLRDALNITEKNDVRVLGI